MDQIINIGKLEVSIIIYIINSFMKWSRQESDTLAQIIEYNLGTLKSIVTLTIKLREDHKNYCLHPID
jgi:hypothetical protein